MLLTPSASIWKLIFALIVALAIALFVYSYIKRLVPAAEFISSILFLVIYAAIVRRLTV